MSCEGKVPWVQMGGYLVPALGETLGQDPGDNACI